MTNGAVIPGGECLSEEIFAPPHRFYVVCALPVLVVAFAVFVKLVGVTCLRAWSDGRVSKRAPQLGAFMWLGYITGFSRSMFAAFNCSAYASSGDVTYWDEFPWVECGSSEWTTYVIIAGVWGMSVVAGSVVFLAYALTKRGSRRLPSMAFLTAPYREKCFYWEAVTVGRRLALAAAIGLSDWNSAALPLSVFSVLLVSLVAQLVYRPLVEKVDNTLEVLSISTLTISYFAAIAMRSGRQMGAGSSSINRMAILVVVANAVVILVLAAAIVLTKARQLKRKLGDWKQTDECDDNALAVPMLDSIERPLPVETDE